MPNDALLLMFLLASSSILAHFIDRRASKTRPVVLRPRQVGAQLNFLSQKVSSFSRPLKVVNSGVTVAIRIAHHANPLDTDRSFHAKLTTVPWYVQKVKKRGTYLMEGDDGREI